MWGCPRSAARGGRVAAGRGLLVCAGAGAALAGCGRSGGVSSLLSLRPAGGERSPLKARRGNVRGWGCFPAGLRPPGPGPSPSRRAAGQTPIAVRGHLAACLLCLLLCSFPSNSDLQARCAGRHSAAVHICGLASQPFGNTGTARSSFHLGQSSQLRLCALAPFVKHLIIQTGTSSSPGETSRVGGSVPGDGSRHCFD